ncbi:MAG: hypothetical protein K9J37_07175 [Saprospiraceae bacterium]|nr:hypothetical protein [Saprospiraceae bacterium]MCF8249678.1 hypothetical protein [Saprospiraceae bacterium]MCF8279837.1 hypothetical protein [Bacteroidales bacterium]MCF8312335.1 hypothetical protein [Saprospiraceae bacterium]MCF8440668.1 hypothetical protein [Saprospiraceae bacterium]
MNTVGARFYRIAVWLPKRCYRISRHISVGGVILFSQKEPKILHWWQDFAFLLLDIVGIPELAETTLDFAKWNTRPLSPLEKEMATSVFGNSLNLNAIRIDERAKIGCQKRNIAYVSYFTINSWGRLRPETLVHELVHIWQYQHLGGAYISRALRAQRSQAGYDYGGLEALRTSMEGNGKITDFNLEQQAEIISDYFCLREGLKPTWGNAAKVDLPVYEYFMCQIST